MKQQRQPLSKVMVFSPTLFKPDNSCLQVKKCALTTHEMVTLHTFGNTFKKAAHNWLTDLDANSLSHTNNQWQNIHNS